MTEATIQRDPKILGGTPIFRGTRVPIRILFEHLEAGDGLDVFLKDFPSVTKEQAVSVLRIAKSQISGSDEAAA